MPGTELFGAEERKEVLDVLETGILFDMVMMHNAMAIGRPWNLNQK